MSIEVRSYRDLVVGSGLMYNPHDHQLWVGATVYDADGARVLQVLENLGHGNYRVLRVSGNIPST